MTERERIHADLKKARAMIEDPQRWTQGASARDAEGAKVAPDDPHACKWCATGALWAACEGDYQYERGTRYDAAMQPLSRAARAVARRVVAGDAESTPTDINDGCAHLITLVMFDRAIHYAASPESAAGKDHA